MLLPMVCKFCLEDKKLIKAHVIPEGFFRRARAGSDHLLVLSQPGEGQATTRQRSRIGEYDMNLVCRDCENQWNDWDSYIQELLIHDEPPWETLNRGRRRLGWRIPEYDYDKLMLFAISFLWRASASTRGYYSGVNIGPFALAAKEIIRAQRLPDSMPFAVCVSRIIDHEFNVATFAPYRDRAHGINYYVVNLPRYILYIKADRRPFPYPWTRCQARRDEPLIIFPRDITKGNVLAVMANMVQNESAPIRQ